MNKSVACTMVAALALAGCAPYQPPAVFDPTPRTELAPGMVVSSTNVARITRLSVLHADLPSDFPGLSAKERETAFGVDFKFTVDETGSVRDIEFPQASAQRQSLGAFRPLRFNESRVAVAGEMQERWLARGCGKAFIAYVWFAFTPDGKTNHALSTSPERVRAIVPSNLKSLWSEPLHHVQLNASLDMEPPGYWAGWEA